MSDSNDTGAKPVERREKRGEPWAWMGGAVLILIGLAFLAQNFGYPIAQNWWAVFIYLAAAVNFVNMWRFYRMDDYFGPKATGSLTGGLLLATIATIFFANADFGRWWPAILISIGAGIVIGGILQSATKKQ
jgi:drug/metabolite transporter (DMT)-like permease